MLSVREACQKLNAMENFEVKLNLIKTTEKLTHLFQEVIEKMLPEQRKMLSPEIMEVFKSVTRTDEEKEELKTPDSSFVPVFKGVWKEVKETLYNQGMTKIDFDALPLTFRSQEVFHLKKKGLVIEKSNDLVKLVKSDKEITIRPKSANGTKSQGNGVVATIKAIKRDYSQLSLEDQISILTSQISDLESKKACLELQVIEKSFNEMFLKSESEKELKQASENSGLEEIDFSQPMAFAAA